MAAARAAQLFNQTPSNNFVYVVLERDQRLARATASSMMR
ncbi:hypothetical protein I548_2568 [Mycobacterium intracellulare]|nr:hypothetical protein I548_2568 [Mycobacterium intracellulare]